MSQQITSNSSLLKYESPVIICDNNVEKAIKESNKKASNKQQQKQTAKAALPVPKNGHLEPIQTQKPEDILPKILPPLVFEQNGQLWLQKVCATPATNLDVQRLGIQLDKRLLMANAKDTGICPLRRRLYAQAFDELIRQITINCVERGLLTLRVRDEINVTLGAYQTLYESATGYGLRKALFTKKDEFETNDRRGELEKQIENGQKEVAKLKGMIEALKTRGIREREEKEEKHEEEIQFLLRINEKRMNQLHSILYS
jgi:dynein light intermediate chain